MASILESLQGYLSGGPQTSADRPNKLAVIDPGYTSGLPKVTFEGESVMSGKGYAVSGFYTPKANDRVLMVPVGTTYMIMCSVVTPTIPTWTAITLPAGWTNYDSSIYAPAAYRKDELGYVKFRGLVKPPTGSAIAANFAFMAVGTLPVDYRPPLHEDFPITNNLGNGFGARVLSTGGVLLPSNVSYTPTGTPWVSLAAIHYQTAA